MKRCIEQINEKIVDIQDTSKDIGRIDIADLLNSVNENDVLEKFSN